PRLVPRVRDKPVHEDLNGVGSFLGHFGDGGDLLAHGGFLVGGVGSEGTPLQPRVLLLAPAAQARGGRGGTGSAPALRLRSAGTGGGANALWEGRPPGTACGPQLSHLLDVRTLGFPAGMLHGIHRLRAANPLPDLLRPEKAAVGFPADIA